MEDVLQSAYIAVPHNKRRGEIMVSSFFDEDADMVIVANNTTAPSSPFSGDIMRRTTTLSKPMSIENVRTDLAKIGQCGCCESDLYTLKATAVELDNADSDEKLHCVMCDTPFSIHVDPNDIAEFKESLAAADDSDDDEDDEDLDDDDSDSDSEDDDEEDDNDSDDDDSDEDDDDGEDDDDADDSDDDSDDEDDDDSEDDDDDDGDLDEDDEDDDEDESYDPNEVSASALETEDEEFETEANTNPAPAENSATSPNTPEVTKPAEVKDTPVTPAPVNQSAPAQVIPADAETITIDLSKSAPTLTAENVAIASISPDSAIMFVNGNPAYRLMASKADENVQPFFSNSLRLSSMVASLMEDAKANNAEVDLTPVGAEPFSVEVSIAKEFNNRVTASIAEEKAKFEQDSEEVQKELRASLSMAALSIAKGMDSDIVNPLREELVASLNRAGINSPAIVDAAIEKGSEGFIKTLLTVANDFMSKPLEVRNELARVIKKAGYKTEAAAMPTKSNQAVSYLKQGNVPFNSSNFESIASAPRSDVHPEDDLVTGMRGILSL